MLYSIVLFLHIIGAVVMFVAVGITLLEDDFHAKFKDYRHIANLDSFGSETGWVAAI